MGIERACEFMESVDAALMGFFENLKNNGQPFKKRCR